MKLSQMDIAIILDTLLGARGVSDGGTLWKYTTDARNAVATKMITQMQESTETVDSAPVSAGESHG